MYKLIYKRNCTLINKGKCTSIYKRKFYQYTWIGVHANIQGKLYNNIQGKVYINIQGKVLPIYEDRCIQANIQRKLYTNKQRKVYTNIQGKCTLIYKETRKDEHKRNKNKEFCMNRIVKICLRQVCAKFRRKLANYICTLPTIDELEFARISCIVYSGKYSCKLLSRIFKKVSLNKTFWCLFICVDFNLTNQKTKKE